MKSKTYEQRVTAKVKERLSVEILAAQGEIPGVVCLVRLKVVGEPSCWGEPARKNLVQGGTRPGKSQARNGRGGKCNRKE